MPTTPFLSKTPILLLLLFAFLFRPTYAFISINDAHTQIVDVHSGDGWDQLEQNSIIRNWTKTLHPDLIHEGFVDLVCKQLEQQSRHARTLCLSPPTAEVAFWAPIGASAGAGAVAFIIAGRLLFWLVVEYGFKNIPRWFRQLFPPDSADLEKQLISAKKELEEKKRPKTYICGSKGCRAEMKLPKPKEDIYDTLWGDALESAKGVTKEYLQTIAPVVEHLGDVTGDSLETVRKIYEVVKILDNRPEGEAKYKYLEEVVEALRLLDSLQLDGAELESLARKASLVDEKLRLKPVGGQRVSRLEAFLQVLGRMEYEREEREARAAKEASRRQLTKPTAKDMKDSKEGQHLLDSSDPAPPYDPQAGPSS
ncbi:hypothetical protein BJ508DRAFT_304121 [Ascobolus immersus RN42]|uniref:Uncharacterized protein n=1 Tax=Ascobolus immersus RN42 TaxID=1160509 RepID=A0A3N4IQT3_ASCIM|nr:hypothetical protein BJ508DRAFT_304121 [Ascobolus immersus RN42]